jgi:hypothetical protein
MTRLLYPRHNAPSKLAGSQNKISGRHGYLTAISPL